MEHDTTDLSTKHVTLPSTKLGPFRCDYCNAPAYERHCKVVCTNCGRVRDCSDLFPQ